MHELLDSEVIKVGCARCDSETIMDPVEQPAAGDRFWCAECGNDLGSWPELYDRYYAPANRMLAEALAKPR